MGTAKGLLVADFCQNLTLPHFGPQQLGATYYYSPLSICCFGIVDCAPKDKQMQAYMCAEGEAKKGVNTVSSLLFRNLVDLEYINKAKGPRAELSITMNNCAGQNKNKMVLRLAKLLVKLGYYRKVSCLFLVVGHTKNCADCLFYLLKINYQKQNVYTMVQLMEVLSKN